MEFASYLAGERWSDHPSCTHAGLSQLARAVNDLTSNESRSRLAPLIPSVIGLSSDDPRLEFALAVHAAAVALRDASLDRQHSLAVGGLVCLAALERSGGSGLPELVEEPFALALASTPEAAGWARRFIDRTSSRWHREEVSVRQTHAVLAMAADGVRSACADFPDDRLRALLASAIDITERFVAAERAAHAVSRRAATETVSRRAATETETVIA
jgi:hypothetical protein